MCAVCAQGAGGMNTHSVAIMIDHDISKRACAGKLVFQRSNHEAMPSCAAIELNVMTLASGGLVIEIFMFCSIWREAALEPVID